MSNDNNIWSLLHEALTSSSSDFRQQLKSKDGLVGFAYGYVSGLLNLRYRLEYLERMGLVDKEVVQQVSLEIEQMANAAISIYRVED